VNAEVGGRDVHNAVAVGMRFAIVRLGRRRRPAVVGMKDQPAGIICCCEPAVVLGIPHIEQHAKQSRQMVLLWFMGNLQFGFMFQVLSGLFETARVRVGVNYLPQHARTNRLIRRDSQSLRLRKKAIRRLLHWPKVSRYHASSGLAWINRPATAQRESASRNSTCRSGSPRRHAGIFFGICPRQREKL